MRKENIFVGLLKKLLRMIGVLEVKKISKREMCQRAIKSGVCPKTCEICAWNENM